jgi:hypothetical protein
VQREQTELTSSSGAVLAQLEGHGEPAMCTSSSSSSSSRRSSSSLRRAPRQGQTWLGAAGRLHLRTRESSEHRLARFLCGDPTDASREQQVFR